MCVCVYVYVSVYSQLCMHTHNYIHIYIYTHTYIPQTELALRGSGGERDIHGCAGTCAESSGCILCKDLYYFLHSAGSRSARFPGCLPPASRRAFAGPKCRYFLRKMYIFSIRYCKMSLLHKENVYIFSISNDEIFILHKENVYFFANLRFQECITMFALQ